MSLSDVILLTSCLANTILALFVLWRNPHSRLHQLFALFVLGTVGWIFSNYMIDLSISETVALFWGRGTAISTALISVSLLYFSYLFPTDHRPSKFFAPFLLIIGLLLTLLSLSNFVVTGMDLSIIPYQVVHGSLYYIFLAIILFGLFVSLLNFLRSFLREKSLEKVQLKFLLIGLGLTIAVTLITNVLLPSFLNINTFVRIGPSSTLFFTIFMAYSILKHRFLDIRLALRFFLLRIFLIIFTTVVIYDAVKIFELSNFTFNEKNVGLAAFLVSSVLIFLYEPLNDLVKTVTDRFLFQKESNREELLAKLTKELVQSLELERLLSFLKKSLQEILRIKNVGFVIKNENHNSDTLPFIWGFEGWNDFDWQKDSLFTEYFGNNQSILISDELRRRITEEKDQNNKEKLQKIKTVVEENKIDIVSPLKTVQNLLGFLAIGEKLSGEAFTEEEVKMVETLSYQASIVIQNANLFSQTQKFNEKLQKEVDKATFDLRKALEDLKALDKMKDELISVASHELRTPMTSIKSYLWMIINKKGAMPEEKKSEYLERAYESSERMIKLVEDMLTVSKIEGGKMEIHLGSSSITDLTDQVIADLNVQAQAKQVSLIFNKPSVTLPLVLMDSDRTREILVNLISNALKYTPAQGKIEVSVKEQNDSVEVNVHDSGKGIAKEDLPRLFQKFGRLEGSFVSSAEAGGTGLGLYITKGLVELQGGKIWVESEKGQGSTFSFILKKS